MGRFINADALVSTGQGILGNNMFAYCNNNPIIYADPTGTKGKIWFQLFEDHDPGYIHRAVQVHILATKNAEAAIYSSEYYMPGVGRADIVCLQSGEMWEIKYGGSTADARTAGINNADTQLERYLLKVAPFKKGRVNAFSGTFVISQDTTLYQITYCTPEQGVVLYFVAQLNNSQGKADFIYAPHTLYEEQKAFVGMIVFAFVSGATSPFPQQEALTGT